VNKCRRHAQTHIHSLTRSKMRPNVSTMIIGVQIVKDEKEEKVILLKDASWFLTVKHDKQREVRVAVHVEGVHPVHPNHTRCLGKLLVSSSCSPEATRLGKAYLTSK
jgi:hypothetical protein